MAGALPVAISAASAKRAWQAAQRFLTLTQLRAALASPTGEIAVSAIVPSVTHEHLNHSQVRSVGWPSTLHRDASMDILACGASAPQRCSCDVIPFRRDCICGTSLGHVIATCDPCQDQSSAWAAARAQQVREGQELELPERVPCAVAFLRNEERNVFLAMHGLPRPPAGVEFGRPLPKAVVRSVPLVLLADAGTRMSTGARVSPGTHCCGTQPPPRPVDQCLSRFVCIGAPR